MYLHGYAQTIQVHFFASTLLHILREHEVNVLGVEFVDKTEVFLDVKVGNGHLSVNVDKASLTVPLSVPMSLRAMVAHA